MLVVAFVELVAVLGGVLGAVFGVEVAFRVGHSDIERAHATHVRPSFRPEIFAVGGVQGDSDILSAPGCLLERLRSLAPLGPKILSVYAATFEGQVGHIIVVVEGQDDIRGGPVHPVVEGLIGAVPEEGMLRKSFLW
jgi:hypothetical protein